MALSAIALTTVSGVKQFGEFPDSTSDDALLEELINRVSALCESYTDGVFVEREFTEYHDGGSVNLFTNYYPITSVTSIWYDSDWAWADTTLISGTDYRIVDDNRILFKTNAPAAYPQGTKITYRAGYATVPEEVEQACIEEVLHRYRGKKQLDVTSRTLDDGTSEYTPRTLLPQVKEALHRYIRKQVV